jgi:hypothetical protein
MVNICVATKEGLREMYLSVQVPDTCMTFATNSRTIFAKNPDLRRCFTVHLINLCEHGLLTAEQMDNCLKVLDAPVDL